MHNHDMMRQRTQEVSDKYDIMAQEASNKYNAAMHQVNPPQLEPPWFDHKTTVTSCYPTIILTLLRHPDSNSSSDASSI
jgi:hypothetical protein